MFRFLNILLGSAMRAWFRRDYVHLEATIPSDAPVIFACTHTNSAVDYLILPIVTKTPVYVLVRADVFRKKIVNWFLRNIWLIPVYRIRDGYSSLTKNQESFKECFDIFEKKGRVLIFSEGVCVQKKQLQPIRKGTARLAFDYIRSGSNKEIYIVPMTNSYTRFRQFRSTIMTHFGKPIRISEYMHLLEENENKAYLKLSEDIAAVWDKNFISVPEYTDNCLTEKALITLRFNRWEKRGEWNIEDISSFEEERLMVDRIKYLKPDVLPSDWEKRFDALKGPEFSEGILKTNARPDFHFMILFSISLFVGLASIFHFIPVKLSYWLIKHKVKDIIFHDTITLFGSAVFYLIQWIIILLILVPWLGFVGLVACMSIPALSYIYIQVADDFHFAWNNLKKLKYRKDYERLYNELMTAINI